MNLHESVVRSPRTGLPCKESGGEVKARVLRYKESDAQLALEMDGLELAGIIEATTFWLGDDWVKPWPRWAD